MNTAINLFSIHHLIYNFEKKKISFLRELLEFMLLTTFIYHTTVNNSYHVVQYIPSTYLS